METMRRRSENGGFGLASSDEEQRKACVEYYRHLHQKINKINGKNTGKVIALELHAARWGQSERGAGNRRLCALIKRDCQLGLVLRHVLEHCDAMTGPAPRKGFLPLVNVLETIADYDISVCINWARSAIEGRDTSLPLIHTQQAKQAGKLGALMFSGTTLDGEYGEWQDLHAPFAPFCPQSLMTEKHVQELITAAAPDLLQFTGIKLLEINASADINHRINILRDGINMMKRPHAANLN